ncbi:response regulator transcription factor [Stenotrophomonas sp. S48]|uniref:response regulator transcription factor n=1 Tax=unclassified Stenotrophomonas TaxID=196198 RepID=UPI00190191EE|nr:MULTISPECIES: response regulator transcription factor [unclassified Stenotrophomonas]MBK0025432.1 response regulator transcription factor [Stenotrophomonas sp. S48]MBK0048803.1 response regulator transcription factor [Stenotrophomonas sp. S49]
MPVLPPLLPDRPRRLALLDPHPVLRLGVEVLLRQHSGVEVCGSYAGEGELLQQLRREPGGIDLLVVDALPLGDLGDGVALLRRLSHQWPQLPVLVLSAHCNASTVTTAMQAGARGFLSKATAPDVLLRAVDVVSRGGRFVPPDLRAQLSRSRTLRAVAPTLAPLSRREREVLRLVLQGCSTGEMALRFQRAASTISTQKKTAYQKLGIRSDGELFRIRHLLECS